MPKLIHLYLRPIFKYCFDRIIFHQWLFHISLVYFRNLSYLRHPSESRLSLVSIGSMASSMTSLPPGKTTFPIPPRDLVRQMHMDKDR